MTDRYPCSAFPDLFFSTDQDDITYAKAVCSRCPSRLACLEAGRSRQESGIWGGETEQERIELGKQQPKERVPAPCGTDAGATRHRRDGEKPCQPCLDAAALAAQLRKARKAEQALAA